MQVDCKTEIIFSSSAKHICCAWLFSAYSALLGLGFPPQAPAWRTALYLALYHYSFHYFFLDFSTTRGATSHSLHPSNIKIFQSTHPLRGATAKLPKYHGKFAKKLQNFCKAEQRAALPRVGQRESGCYFRPCAVRTSRRKPERFRFASDNERALRSVARLCAEVLDAGFILVSKVIKA